MVRVEPFFAPMIAVVENWAHFHIIVLKMVRVNVLPVTLARNILTAIHGVHIVLVLLGLFNSLLLEARKDTCRLFGWASSVHLQVFFVNRLESFHVVGCESAPFIVLHYNITNVMHVLVGVWFSVIVQHFLKALPLNGIVHKLNELVY